MGLTHGFSIRSEMLRILTPDRASAACKEPGVVASADARENVGRTPLQLLGVKQVLDAYVRRQRPQALIPLISGFDAINLPGQGAMRHPATDSSHDRVTLSCGIGLQLRQERN
eukprot:4136398-Pleurochrysis_carterae.AAC.1